MSEPILPPEGWPQWEACLRALAGERDPGPRLRAMAQGRLDWSPALEEPFLRALSQAVNTRLNRALGEYRRGLRLSLLRERRLVSAVDAMALELGWLWAAVSIPALPQVHREQFRAQLQSQARSMQAELAAQARRDPTGRLSALLGEHPVDRCIPKEPG